MNEVVNLIERKAQEVDGGGNTLVLVAWNRRRLRTSYGPIGRHDDCVSEGTSNVHGNAITGGFDRREHGFWPCPGHRNSFFSGVNF